MQYEIRPLRKTNESGALYTHTSETIDALPKLASLNEATLEEHCKIHHKERAEYVSNACLVHLLRNTQGSDRIRSALFTAVVTRITQVVRRKVRDLPQQYADDITEVVVSAFIEMLVSEPPGYNEDLDSLERYFRKTVIMDCLDAFRSLRRKEKKRLSLESNDPDEPPPKEIRTAIEAASDAEFVRTQDKAMIAEAISRLEPFHATILKLDHMGYPVHSTKGERCMTMILKKSEKTIHTHYALALAELRQELQGDQP